MAMIPHFSFWVLVSPALYRALHRTIEGADRLLWVSMLFGWSAIALTGSTAMSFFSYVIRHDLQPTFRQLVEIYFLPPAGPAFWAMNFSILASRSSPSRAVRTVRCATRRFGTRRRPNCAAQGSRRSSRRRACRPCRRRSTRISC